jgi:hypothetical protein
MKLLIPFLICLLLPIMVHAQADPVFAGVWSEKEGNSLGGGLYVDQTWEGLVAHWKQLGANQYLADVEVYRQNGKLRYAGLWRVGSGNGALFVHRWDEFIKTWNELKQTQELIDIEIFTIDDDWRFLGVWRQKSGPKRGGSGSGAFLVGLTWEQLVAKRKELGEGQYLAEVETYVDKGQRLFAGVWRVGSGNGALFLMTDWSQFNETKRSLDSTQEMIDFEMFQDDKGKWNFLGLWRDSGKKAGPLQASISDARFRPVRVTDFLERVNKTRPKYTLVDISVATPAVVLRGDLNCKFGDVDCNRCVNDVPAQFKLGKFDGGSWVFSGERRYPPDNYEPAEAFKPFDTGIASKHIQGLVRTNDATYPYAGSHSHEKTGSIFFLKREKDGDLVLNSLHRSNVDHPSGVAILGDGLYVAEGEFLRSFGVFSNIDNQETRYLFPKIDPRQKGLQGAGGGLGLAKLEDGGYLLVVSAPGDGFRLGTTIEGVEQNEKPRYTRFYRIVGSDPGHPEKLSNKQLNIQFLGEWKHEGNSKRPDKPLAYSENLSVVTECGTGNIYTIHTTGQYLLDGDGYWRLSRIESGADGPRLRHISIIRQAQENKDCHHRSSATVHVNKSGGLEFLCSERTVVDRKPSGRFNFKENK